MEQSATIGSPSELRLEGRAARVARAGAIFAITILLSACAAPSDSTARAPTRDDAVSSAAAAPSAPVADDGVAENADSSRLALMWRERNGKLADFPIGPGDLLEISVPGIDQLRDRAARVGGDGHIYLPLAGDLPVAGETEKAIRGQVNQRMNKYLYHPQADIFVKSYASRQVAVMGAIGRPGMYVLNGPEDTVRELLERAGGISDNGAREIVLTPTLPGRQGAPSATRGPLGGDSAAVADSPLNHRAPDGRTDSWIEPISDFSPPSPNADSVVISLTAGSASARYADMPARPGDTIYVPMAGSVTVIGWVYKPKTIAITPGLTVLGAVSAAGGALFAGDTRSVKLIRQKNNGESETIDVNLELVKRHEAPNRLVQANDIIEVPYSAVRLPGYAVYYAMLGIFQWAPAAVVTSGM
jgi:protein involved in polysaccharide export with SLBB domain